LVIVSPGCVHLLGTCVTLDPTPLLATAKAPPPRFGSVAARVFIDLIDKTPVVIYAGQRDPVDASHFTIRFVRGAAEAIVDGYLEDDGSVRLCERDGRATRPRNPLPPPVFSW
jgi:hypothetical protein